ncbi:MAG: tetratricopeptide repeat protein [Planctomycetes bacterium]|nr:tetratricopeptide repeat protein [Planctomycetota bacterium]
MDGIEDLLKEAADHLSDQDYPAACRCLLAANEQKTLEAGFVEGIVPVFLDAGAYDQVIALLEGVAARRALTREEKGNLAAALNDRAVERFRAGDLEAGEKLCEQAVKADPTLSSPHTNLGKLCYHRGEAMRALWHYVDALDRDADNTAARFNLGLLYAESGLFTAAAEQFRRILDLDPDYPGIHSELGMVLLERGEREEAEKVLRAGMAREPENDSILSNLGYIAILAQREEEAEGMWTKSLHANPDNVASLQNLACLMALRDRWDEAMDFLTRLNKVNGDLARKFLRDDEKSEQPKFAALSDRPEYRAIVRQKV